MKNTVKYAVAGACALAASSTAVLAQEIPAGFTAGIDLASPLPTGIYAFDINGLIATDHSAPGLHGNFYATVPGLIWSSPYEIAGGKLGMTGYFAYGDYENDFGNGLGFHAGVRRAMALPNGIQHEVDLWFAQRQLERWHPLHVR